MANRTKFEILFSTMMENRGLRRLRDGLRSVRNLAGRAGAALRKIGTRAAIAGIGALTAAVYGLSKAVGAAGDFEMLKAQLEAVMATSEEAAQAFEESWDFSESTPFSPQEIIQTRIALEGVGIKGGEAVESVAGAAAALDRNILDIASAVKSLETEPLRNLGIMLRRDGDEFLFEYKDKMQKARAIEAQSFEQAQDVLLTILSERYAGGVERMAMTLQGKLSTLQGVWKSVLADFGQGYIDEIKAGVDHITAKLDEWKESGAIRAAGERVGEILSAAAQRLQTVTDEIGKYWAYFQNGGDLREVMEGVGLIVKGHIVNAADAAVQMVLRAAPVIGEMIGESARKVFTGLAEGISERVAFIWESLREGNTLTEAFYQWRFKRPKEERDRDIEGIAGNDPIVRGRAILDDVREEGEAARRQQRSERRREKREQRVAPLGSSEEVEGWLGRFQSSGDRGERLKSLRMIEAMQQASEEENRRLAEYLRRNKITMNDMLRQLMRADRDMADVYARLKTLETQSKNNRK